MLIHVLPIARCLVFGLILGGCASAIESSNVKTRFAEVFDCPFARVQTDGSGYQVEGCGNVAYFSCPQRHDHHHERHDLAEVLFDSLLGPALVPGTCVLEHTHASAPPTPAPRRVSQGEGALRSRLLLHGGAATLLGRPTKTPAHALLTLQSAVPLAPEPCVASLRRDGVEFPVKTKLRTNDHELLLLVPLAQLRTADRATEFGGSACGFEFEFDEAARRKLSAFEERFRATLAGNPPT